MEQRSDAELQAILEENLAADLMSMFPDSYRSEHQNAQYRQLSYAAKINLRTLDELYDNLRDEPEVNLLSIFPKNYTRRITMATGLKVLPGSKKDSPEEKRRDFRTRLDLAETATIIFPLSEQVTSLLARYPGDCLNESNDAKEKISQYPCKNSCGIRQNSGRVPLGALWLSVAMKSSPKSLREIQIPQSIQAWNTLTRRHRISLLRDHMA
jgi:hypothetical protein